MRNVIYLFKLTYFPVFFVSGKDIHCISTIPCLGEDDSNGERTKSHGMEE
jgi:hypothetical protein